MSRHEYPDVIIVDKNDNEIGRMQMPEATAAGHYMRVSHVLVINSNNELLVQQRSQNIWLPGLWNASAAGHVDVGETYELAAVRELEEEMGIKAEVRQLVFLKKVLLQSKRNTDAGKFHSAYVVKYDGPVHPDEYEVGDYTWMPVEEVIQDTKKNPDKYTHVFVLLMDIYAKKFVRD